MLTLKPRRRELRYINVSVIAQSNARLGNSCGVALTPLKRSAVEDLFHVLALLPPLTHCSKCGFRFVYFDKMFFSPKPDEQESWTVPLPFCTRCERTIDGAKFSLPVAA